MNLRLRIVVDISVVNWEITRKASKDTFLEKVKNGSMLIVEMLCCELFPFSF